MPKVRPRFVYETATLRTGRPAPQFRLLAGIFAVSLVVDHPQQTLDVGAATLRRWDADFDALLQKARSNLVARGGEEGFLRMGPGRYRSTWQDGLDGSRLLLPGVLRRLDLDGDPLVLLPSPGTLLVVGSEDIPAQRWALAAALEFLDTDPHAQNGCPLRLRHFDWSPSRPPPGTRSSPSWSACASAGSATSTPARRPCWTSATTGPERPSRSRLSTWSGLPTARWPATPP
jgi:hypothetical protein